MRVGDLAPDFSLPDQHGVTRSLSTLLADGPVVLFFYPAAMTAGCTKEACAFRDEGAAFAALHAQRVGISMDSVDKQQEFSAAHTFDYPLLADVNGAVAKSFGVKRPLNLLKVKRSTFVINQDRTIRAIFTSETNMGAHVTEALAALAN